MSELRFTPGPWRLGPINYADVYCKETGELIALAVKDRPETVADAILIAAAPELYAALDGLLALCEKQFGLLQQSVDAGFAKFTPLGMTFDRFAFVKKSRAALAKARGESEVKHGRD